MEATFNKEDGKFEYGTLQEAERRMKECLDKRSKIYCVMRKGCCRTDCGCFKEPKIINNGPDDQPLFEVEGGYCTCYCLVGPT